MNTNPALAPRSTADQSAAPTTQLAPVVTQNFSVGLYDYNEKYGGYEFSVSGKAESVTQLCSFIFSDNCTQYHKSSEQVPGTPCHSSIAKPFAVKVDLRLHDYGEEYARLDVIVSGTDEGVRGFLQSRRSNYCNHYHFSDPNTGAPVDLSSSAPLPQMEPPAPESKQRAVASNLGDLVVPSRPTIAVTPVADTAGTNERFEPAV